MQTAIFQFNAGINPIYQLTEIKQSSIHGFGIFAKKFIPQGTILWYARPEDVSLYTREQIMVLSSSMKNVATSDLLNTILTYSYYEMNENCLVFCLDNSRYTNHSLTPNSGATSNAHGFCSIALRDIKMGDEITENYFDYPQCDWLSDYKENYPLVCW